MTFKKIILILLASIFIILFAVLEYRIFLKQTNHKIPIICKCPRIEAKTTKEWKTKEWNTYYDERYKYRIDFPVGLKIATTHENMVKRFDGGFLTINGGVSFSPKDFPGIMGVKIFENSKFSSPDEWFENENSKKTSRIVEKKINIDGNEAIITYEVSISMLNGKIIEEYKYDKSAVFIKNGNLFLIWTKFRNDDDHEKVLNSFKFITGDYPIY